MGCERLIHVARNTPVGSPSHSATVTTTIPFLISFVHGEAPTALAPRRNPPFSPRRRCCGTHGAVRAPAPCSAVLAAAVASVPAVPAAAVARRPTTARSGQGGSKRCDRLPLVGPNLNEANTKRRMREDTSYTGC